MYSSLFLFSQEARVSALRAAATGKDKKPDDKSDEKRDDEKRDDEKADEPDEQNEGEADQNEDEADQNEGMEGEEEEDACAADDVVDLNDVGLNVD